MEIESQAADSDVPHIVCVGGGYVAIFLYRHLKGWIRRGRLRMTVIDRNNYQCFHGLVPEMLAGKIQPGNVLSSSRKLFARARFRNAEIEQIDLERKRLVISRALDGKQFRVDYDHLVFNLGSVEELGRFPGIAEHTMRLKSFPDILRVRHHLITMLELADIEDDPVERGRLLTTVIVGGNYAGVEVCGELIEFLPKVVRRRFPNIPIEEIRIVLVHSGKHILPELGLDYPKLQAYAERAIRDEHLDLKLETRLAAATPEEAVLDNGERIPTRTIISCTGTKVAPILEGLPLEKDAGGRVVTDPFMRVRGFDGLWAGGDCAAVPHPNGGACPPLAIWAITAGQQIGKNFKATIGGKRLKPYRFNGLGDACTLGKWRAAVHLKGFPMRGLIGYMLWRFFMVRYVPSLEKKVRVVWDWLLLPIVGRDLINMNIDRPLGLAPVRFEPGQDIIRQGDVGRGLYIIRSGEVEVIKLDGGGKEKQVATLVEGEHFGEVAVFENVRRTATVRAITQVELLQVSSDAAVALSDKIVGDLRE